MLIEYYAGVRTGACLFLFGACFFFKYHDNLCAFPVHLTLKRNWQTSIGFVNLPVSFKMPKQRPKITNVDEKGTFNESII